MPRRDGPSPARDARAPRAQRRSRDRDDARIGSDAAVGRRRAARRHHHAAAAPVRPGQSFGAFVPRGISLRLEGEANDFVGKGLSGGRLIVRAAARRRASSPKTTSSSATSCSTARPAARPTSAASRASASPCGTAARRAVVEGVGDHGCEYMTGGRVVVLGRDRAELRRRHERRHRLRARSRAATSRALQPRARRARTASAEDDERELRRLLETPRRAHRQQPGGVAPGRLAPRGRRRS